MIWDGGSLRKPYAQRHVQRKRSTAILEFGSEKKFPSQWHNREHLDPPAKSGFGTPSEIFQQDNARPHTARVAQDFLRHFQALPWPARSPDLSPVEHVWDQLKRQMPSCHSVHDLDLAVQD
ncbi:transposable element Tcb2 transposase [Trichonephila clavipes]|nr:transposable element Tcb2 transposase [Trichonephila clavipes]